MTTSMTSRPTAAADWRALGTSVRLVTTDPALLDSCNLLLARHLAEVDAACSRFRADSELSTLNAAEGHPVKVSPLLAFLRRFERLLLGPPVLLRRHDVLHGRLRGLHVGGVVTTASTTSRPTAATDWQALGTSVRLVTTDPPCSTPATCSWPGTWPRSTPPAAVSVRTRSCRR